MKLLRMISLKSKNNYNDTFECFTLLLLPNPSYFHYVFINRNIYIWHTFLQDHLPTKTYTINQHYLTQHLVDNIENFGPPRYYSSRPLERTVGYLKPWISSLSKPAGSACNAMLDITAIAQFYRQCSTEGTIANTSSTVSNERMPISSQNRSITIEIEDESNAMMTLRELETTTLDAFDDLYDLRSLLTDFYTRNNIDGLHTENAISIGKQAIIRGRVFSQSPRQNAKRKDLAKMTIPEDHNARRG